MSDKDRMDRIFAGLYEASGINLPEEEKARLREVFQPMCDLAARVRRRGRHWTERMQPFHGPGRTHPKSTGRTG